MTYNFWRNGKITGHFTLEDKEIRAKFDEWLKTKSKSDFEDPEILIMDRLNNAVNMFCSECLDAVRNDMDGEWKNLNSLLVSQYNLKMKEVG